MIKQLIELKGVKDMTKDYSRIAKEIGETIREARQRAHYTRKGLAKASGVSRNQILNIEQGNVRATIEILDMLCVALNIKITQVLKAYEDERWMYKNKQQSLQPIALLDDTNSQSPQDTQEENNFKSFGLAGGDKSAKIKLKFIKLHKLLYYTKVVIKVWKTNLKYLAEKLSF